MSNYVVGQNEDQRGKTFGAATIATLLIGVVLAVVVILRFRSPPPVVIEHPPEIRVVEKFSPAPAPPPAPPPPAAPPMPPPAPPPPPPPVLKTQPTGFRWAGVWHPEKYPLPMFRLAEVGGTVVGQYSPNWSTVLPFKNGMVDGNDLTFAVDDGIFRVHFRMIRVGEWAAQLEAWITPDDWAESLIRANRVSRTPQQALLARQIMENNLRLRVPKIVGTFWRQPQ